MDSQNEQRKIKCPHCGWIRTVPVGVLKDEIIADAVRGVGDTLRALGERIKGLLADPALDEANAWIDVPACPHCQNEYRYNVRTGEVTK
jgi:RNase P subunit RPR2